ncbi:phosphocholine cytidylyltransferase family protein [Numidum massiliense]|uniref:phosphocholine cytidylyltransferase family protein n=1 Tax=Numidum massiliense TaxID=1522315 RepID=UPI0006D588B7|nr:phosphocholine cytidylyltransferase family protein [Numidum massiliense]
MKVVILAAGVGSRLHPETADKPKAMICVKDKPLIQYQVESVLRAGFTHDDIYVLGGYKVERIKEHFQGTDVHFIDNPHYATMNNIYSFLLTREIDDDLLLINSDDFYDERLIPRLLDASARTAILVDQQKVLTEEAMRVQLEDGVLRFVNKKIPLAKADGEYIGISKLGAAELDALYRRAEEMIAAGDTNAWYENVYEACAEQIDIVGVDTGDYRWIEIDDFNDLEEAQQLATSLVRS